MSGSKGIYVSPRAGWPGYLLWLRDRTLVAQRFDGKTHMEGDPIPLADDILANPVGRAAFWASDTGLLLYRTGSGRAGQLEWVGRDGKREVIGTADPEAQPQNPRLSPDGTRVVFDRFASGGVNSTRDVWVYEFARGGVLTRLTTGPRNNEVPVWSPDGRQVAFGSDREGAAQIYRKDSNGTGSAEQLTRGGNPKIPLDWSRDGRYLLYEEQDPKTGLDVWALPLEGDRKPIPILHTAFNERDAQFSPDGKWVVYASDETGTYQIYVQSFPPSEFKKPVSNGGGVQPRWQGNEIDYFVGGGIGNIWAAGVRAEAGRLQLDAPHELPVPYSRFSQTIHYDVTRDGQRFLEIQPQSAGQDASANDLTVISNWQAGLRK